MTGGSLPFKMCLGGVACCVLSVAVAPWSFGGAVDMPLWSMPGWPPLPIGLVVLFAALVPVLRPAHPTSRVMVSIVAVSAASASAYAVVLMFRYDYTSASYNGWSNLMVEFPGPGGPLAILGAALGAAGAFAASRRVTPRSRPAAQQVDGGRG